MNKVQVFEISGFRQEDALSAYRALETASQLPLNNSVLRRWEPDGDMYLTLEGTEGNRNLAPN